jgi:probable H4MPT-linked C1 transfer pathway protein
MTAAVLGLDVGGANLKAAWSWCSRSGAASLRACSVPFALWREPARLRHRLRELLDSGLGIAVDQVAVTMTGELCDCYATKREGVHAILDAVEQAAPVPIRVWTTAGRFLSLAEAREAPLTVAAANWLALAAFAARFAGPSGPALLIDIGSTTTDLIPIVDGQPAPLGRTDAERLHSGTLVYTGARRTPVCAILGRMVAAELFATMLDVYLLLGEIPEDAVDTNTADGRPATRLAAEARLARMLGADLETSTREERLHLARWARLRQMEIILLALHRVLDDLPGLPRTVVLAGEGEFLAREMFCYQDVMRKPRIVSLTEQLGARVSRSACAHAVAVLAAEAKE